MSIPYLRTIQEIVQMNGVKCVTYSGPGMGKTPACATAPNPVFCLTEPGFASLRGLINTRSLRPCFTGPDIRDFFDWLDRSAESRSFDTVVVDSGPQITELLLSEYGKGGRPSQPQRGQANQDTMKIMNQLYYMPRKHVIILAKEGMEEFDGVNRKTPIFPGKELNSSIPYLFDDILHIELVNINGAFRKAFRTRQSYNVVARDRYDSLEEFEPTNFAHIFGKIMSGKKALDLQIP